MQPRVPAPPLAVLALLLCAVLAPGEPRADDGEPLLAPPAPAIPVRPASLPGAGEYGCVECHAEVGAEWAESTHGLAWVDEAYQAALAEKKRPELCHGCHAPEPLLAGLLAGRPAVRADDVHLGVSCESCHVDAEGAMLGPRGTPVDAHPSKVSPHMSAPGSNELCSACHSTNIGPVLGVAKDFEKAGMAERGLSCVGCHMAPVTRAWATGAPERTGRSHALQTPRDPRFLRLAFGFALERRDGAATVVVSNQAGHRVPGLHGRRLDLTAELLDAAGNVVEAQELSFDERSYLPVDGTREIRFTHEGAGVRLRGVHKDPRVNEAVAFLDETLAED